MAKKQTSSTMTTALSGGPVAAPKGTGTPGRPNAASATAPKALSGPSGGANTRLGFARALGGFAQRTAVGNPNSIAGALGSAGEALAVSKMQSNVMTKMLSGEDLVPGDVQGLTPEELQTVTSTVLATKKARSAEANDLINTLKTLRETFNDDAIKSLLPRLSTMLGVELTPESLLSTPTSAETNKGLIAEQNTGTETVARIRAKSADRATDASERVGMAQVNARNSEAITDLRQRLNLAQLGEAGARINTALERLQRQTENDAVAAQNFSTVMRTFNALLASDTDAELSPEKRFDTFKLLLKEVGGFDNLDELTAPASAAGGSAADAESFIHSALGQD